MHLSRILFRPLHYWSFLNIYLPKPPLQKGLLESWMALLIPSIIETARESIHTSKKINELREEDMRKIQALGKREATSGVKFLQHLFKNPVTSNAMIVTALQFSRAGAAKLLDRFIQLGILKPLDETVKYGKTYNYKRYIDIFNE